MRLLRWALLALGLGAFAISDLHGLIAREEPFVPGAELLRAVAPDAPSLSRREGSTGTYYSDEGARGAGRATAAAFVTNQVKPVVKGYSGEISLMVGVDDSGTVSGVRLLDHRETPSYMRTVINSGFLEKLSGRRIGAELAGVDAVTGATITSSAIREDILQGGALVCREHMGLDVPGVSPPPGLLASLAKPRSIAMLLAMALAVAAFTLRSFRPGRVLSLAGGLIVVGVYCDIPLSTAHFTNLASLRPPSPADAPLILLLLFVFATGLVYRTRVYCDYLCPFAAVQEAAYALAGRHRKVSAEVWRKSGVARHLLLFTIAILVSVGGYHAVGAMEPYVFLFNPGTRLLPWIYVATVVAAAFFVRRFWCRIFCPCGACVELVASIRRGRSAGAGPDPRADARIERGPAQTFHGVPGRAGPETGCGDQGHTVPDARGPVRAPDPSKSPAASLPYGGEGCARPTPRTGDPK